MYKYDRYDTYVYKVTMTITMFNVKCTVRRNKADNACFVHVAIYNSQRNNAKTC